MKTMILAIAAMVFSVANVNAETVKDVNSNEAAPLEVQIAKTNHRTMFQTVNSGATYKYDFILDDEERVINKITSMWNSSTNAWQPLSAYSVVYTKDETVLSYAKYNNVRKTFSNNVQQTRYNASEYPVIISVPSCCK